MTKTLITGGLGFIGSNIAKLLLEEGYDVTVLDNLSSGHARNLNGIRKATFIEGDVRNVALVSKITESAEVVFHLAAVVGNTRSIERPIEDSEVNILGTLNVLEAARAAGVRRLVYSSSAAIFGELKQLPIREDHPAEPASPYGVSKLAAEKHCLAYAKLYDLEAICLRYFNVYGINQRYDAYGNVIPIFVQRLLRNEPLVVYDDGEQTRDFVNVSDVARANLLAANAKGISGAFNIASGTAITVNALVDIMRDVSGIPPKIKYAPPRKGEVRHSRADITAARQNLGFEPVVDITSGLAEYIDWVKTELAST